MTERPGVFVPLTLLDELRSSQQLFNEMATQQLEHFLLSQVKTKEQALRAEFRKHGWGWWIEIHEQIRFGVWVSWRAVKRRPRGAPDWLRHKLWAFKVWLVMRRHPSEES